MKRLNSAFYLIIPGGPIIVIPAFSVQEVMKEQDICLNCKYFHQKEDWRDTPGGIYMPSGECRCSKPGKDGYPKLHAGNHCFKFKRVKEDARRKSGKRQRFGRIQAALFPELGLSGNGKGRFM